MILFGFYEGSNSGEEPKEVLEHLKDLKALGSQDHVLQWFVLGTGERPMEGVLLHWENEGRHQKRLAAMIPDSDGAWKVDYPAFACISKPAWGEMVRGEAAKGRVRVVFSESHYYNGKYLEDDWTCYLMTSLGVDKVVYGYARKGSIQETALEYLAASAPKDEDQPTGKKPQVRAILDISRPDHALPNQFEIVRVLARDWVMGDTPFDERFEDKSRSE